MRFQEGFFHSGVSELKPLTLREVAEAIDMHESTVSRVTSNKYLHCDRGTFEMKYFFTSGVGADADGEGGASSASVKARIRALTDAEDAKAILSDDKLVAILKDGKASTSARPHGRQISRGVGHRIERAAQAREEAGGVLILFEFQAPALDHFGACALSGFRLNDRRAQMNLPTPLRSALRWDRFSALSIAWNDSDPARVRKGGRPSPGRA